jgi:nicotinate phosphoribosyltransferase
MAIKFDENSLLYNDLYKFTMMWAVINKSPDSKVRYKFFDRNNTIYPKGFAKELRKVVDTFRNRTVTDEKLKIFEKKAPFLPKVFFDFLKGYRFDPSEVGIMQKDNGELDITIDGYHYRTILWEVPLMNAISKLYHQMTNNGDNNINLQNALLSTSKKVELFRLNNIKFVDFGTRRAYSPQHHANVVNILASSKLNKNSFIGTSNVELGIVNDLMISGTYAHEYVSSIGATQGYAHANKHTFDAWTETYQGSLGIALTDTFLTDMFLKDFDSKYANLFTGVRHDSGDPLEFTDKIIKHYETLGIDPTTKTIIYSDGLNPDEVLRIDDYRKGEIRKSYGIGTNLTCDIDDVKSLNIVIKLIEINNLPVIKISDNPGKSIGDIETIDFVKWQIKQLLNN